MKLSNEAIVLFDSLIQTSLTMGISKLVIEPGKIRGIDAKQTVTVITADNVPDFNEKQVGINRLDNLAARLNLIKSQGTPVIEFTVAANDNNVSLLDLSANKVKAQFRCASIESIKGVPKNVTDKLVWELKFDARILPLINQAINAMGSEIVTIASKDGKTVMIEIVDQNKDVFTTELTEPPVWIDSGEPVTSFCQKYFSKGFVTMLREAFKSSDVVTILLGENGIIKIKLNGFDFFMLPTV